MINAEAVAGAKATIAAEQISREKGIQPPSDLTEGDLVALHFIHTASKFVKGYVSYGSPVTFEELLKKELQPLLESGAITENEIGRLLPLLEQYWANEVGSQFTFLHAFLNLISRIPDNQAQELIIRQREKSLHERATENPSVGHRIRSKKWGPPSDGNEFG